MNQNPSTKSLLSLDGKCIIKRLLRLSIKNKANLFKLSIYFSAQASCAADDDLKSVVCNNTPDDEYAFMKSFTVETCALCDTSCPPNHLIGVFQTSEKSTNGMPAKFQKLRDLMNETCNDFGSTEIPASLQKAVGLNTISGDELTENIMEELKNLFPELKDADFNCLTVNKSGVCNCGDGPIYPSQRKYLD